MTAWPQIALRRVLVRNEGGVWGEEPTGQDDTVVLRSTDIGLNGEWTTADPAMRSLSKRDRDQFTLLEGDLVVVKSSGSEDHIGKAALVDGVIAEDRPAFANFVQRLRLAPAYHARFAWYVINSTNTKVQLRLTGTTSTGLRNLSAESLSSIVVPLPPFTAQREIAAFLDRETARIDSLIITKRRMMELLEQRASSHFALLVESTRALVVPIRRAITFITDGPFGSAFSSDDYANEGAAVVRLGNIGFAEYRHEGQAFIPLDLFSRFVRYRVRAGDLLIAGLGDLRNHAGRACVAPDLGLAIVKGKCFCAHIDVTRALPDYLALLLSSPIGADAIGLAAHGSTRAMINLDIVKSTPIPLPTLVDQERIVQDVRAVRDTMFRINDMLSNQIDLLTERRQVLIAAAITGSLRIPEAAA